MPRGTNLVLTGSDGATLRGMAYQPGFPARAVVLLAHGIGEHHRRYGRLIQALTGRGYAVAAIDHRGHGESEGPRALVRDIDVLAEDFLLLVTRARQDYPDLPLVLLGHSMGGLITVRTVALAQERDGVAGLVTSGAALIVDQDTWMVERMAGALLARVAPRVPVRRLDPAVLSRDPAVARAIADDPLMGPRWVKAGTAMALLRGGRRALAQAHRIRVPLLAMHGADDRLASPRGSKLLVQRVGSEDKTLRLWPGLRHEIFNEPEGPTVIAAVIDWLDARFAPPRCRSAR